jgi:hypothetical protein
MALIELCILNREDLEDRKEYFLSGLRGLRGSIFNVITNTEACIVK